MQANFLGGWGFADSVMREESFTQNYDYSPRHGSFGDAGAHWMFHGDAFGSELHNPFAFDFSESYKSHDPEPMSPSSVATTPTTSEQPVVVNGASNQAAVRHDEVSYSDDEYYGVIPPSSAVPKKLRRSFTHPTVIMGSSASGDRNGRKKKYDAPPGVWRNSGGFISTVYINKKRVYGPLRRDVSDAVRDREEMLMAKSVINTEEGMRAFVQAMKERCGASRVSVSIADAINSAQEMALSNYSSSMSFAIPDTVRVSNRPLRSAAKRNIYVSTEYDPSQSSGMNVFEEENSSYQPFL
jgi:hypothetical protein